MDLFGLERKVEVTLALCCWYITWIMDMDVDMVVLLLLLLLLLLVCILVLIDDTMLCFYYVCYYATVLL